MRTVDGTTRVSVWDDWERIQEYAPGNDRKAEYLQGAHGVIKSWTNNNTEIYYYQDSHGSTTHIANASGQLLESYRYDLYGKATFVAAGEAPSQPQSAYGVTDLWTGERWMGELGLYDLRNRFMSPEIGRFLQPDPIGFKGDASNLYRYCHNDPVDFTDPMGLEGEVDLEQLSIRATLKAAKAYRTNNPEGLGRGVWGAHRRDGTGYDEFPVKAQIREGYRWYGPRKRWEAYEIEPTPKVNNKKYDYWAYAGHVHGRKGEKDFSDHDGARARERVVVTRVDADDVDKDGNLKPGHTVKRAIPRKNGGTESRDVYKEPGTASSEPSGISPGMANAMTFASLYLSFGLGAESVNIGNGPR